MRHLIQICNLATGSKVVSWTGALNSQVSGSDRPANCRLRNHCVVRIYPQVASLSPNSLQQLESQINPILPCNDFGKQLYLDTVQLIFTLMQNDDLL